MTAGDDWSVVLLFLGFIFVFVGGILIKFTVVFTVGAVIALIGTAMWLAVPIIQIATTRR